jgi:hypothetical protein
VTVTGNAVTAEGLSWVPVSSPAGNGWMAASFLAKEAPATSTGSSQPGPVTPIFKYRAVVTVASD